MLAPRAKSRLARKLATPVEFATPERLWKPRQQHRRRPLPVGAAATTQPFGLRPPAAMRWKSRECSRRARNPASPAMQS